MHQGTTSSRRLSDRDSEVAVTLPPMVIRAVGALLALAIAVAHVADQGGITAFTAPDWLGWAYRLIEVGGVLTAAVLLWPRSGRVGWAAGALLGVGPFVGYLVSRTVGVPGDPGDVGNWSDWLGTLALIIEAGLFTASVAMVLGLAQARPSLAAPATPLSIDAPQRLSRL